MLTTFRLLRRFVTINLRPIKTQQQKKSKLTWQQLIYSSTMHFQYNIPRILKGQPKTEALMKEVENIDPNEEWYIVDMLKMMSLCASESYFSSTLLEDLHKFLVRYVNAQEFYDKELFYALSEFLDIRSNIPLLKNARMQAYSRLYKRLDPFQREIIVKDYLDTYRTGEFINEYLEDYEHIQEDFKPIQLPNRDTEFEFAKLKLHNRMALRNVVKDKDYWTSKRLTAFYSLLDQYLSILQDKTRLGKIVRYYQSPEIFLAGLHLPNKDSKQQEYKQRLAKIIQTMYDPDNYGAFNLKDDTIQSVIIANFSRNDRILLQKPLLYICELAIRRFPVMRAETVVLMQYCSYIHVGYILSVFKSFFNKMKSHKQIPKYLTYKPAREILIVVNALDKLKFRKVLAELVSQEDMNEFYDLFLYAVRGFIYGDKSNAPKEINYYMNIMPQYLSSFKYLPSAVDQIPRLSQPLQRLINNEKSLGIQTVVPYVSDIRLETELPPLGIFIIQLEALETILSFSQTQLKYGSTSFKQMSNSILNIKTSLNYICSPRVFDTFLRIKALIKRRFKNFDWNLIDNDTAIKVKMQFDDVWNTLEDISQKNKHKFLPDPRYSEYLFEIESAFAPPMLNFGHSSLVDHNNSNLNFSTNFTYSEKNIIQNTYSNKILPCLYEQSNLKKTIEGVLKEKQIKYTKNYVDYPFYADFMIEGAKEKTVVFSVDYSKMYMRNEDTPMVTKLFEDNVEYFNDLKYNVVTVLYSDVAEGKLKQNILEKLTKIKQ